MSLKNFYQLNNSKSPLYIILVIISAVIIFLPTLIGQIILNKDIIFLYLPGFEFVYNQGLTIHPHLWYSGIIGGIPIFATQIGITFHPLYQLIIHLLGPINAFNWTTFGNLILGILSAYWFGKMTLKTRVAAASFASIYSMSQMNMEQIYYPSVTPFFYILPLTFGIIFKINQGKRWYFYLLIPVWVTAWLIGHPQFAFYTALASLLFAIFLDINSSFFSIKKPRLITTAFFLAGIASAVIIISPWILRSSLFVEFSSRAEIKTIDQLLLGAINPLTLTRFIYPYFRIPVFNITCCGGGILYVGTAALILALSSFFVPATRIIRFFRFLFLSFFITALYIPPLINLLFHLPIIKYFLYPFRTIFISDFALAMLSAYSIDIIYENRLTKKANLAIMLSSIFLAISGLIMLMIGIILPHIKNIFVKIAANYMASDSATQTGLAGYNQVIDKVFSDVSYLFSITNPQFLVSLIFILAPGILYLIYRFRGWDNKKLATGMALLIIAGPAIVWLPQYKFGSANIINNTPNTAKYINSVEDSEKFRILRMTKYQGDYEKSGYNLKDINSVYNLYMESANANSNIYNGLESMNGYENFMSRRHILALSYLDNYPENKNKLAELAGIMNIKYIISSYDLGYPFEKVFTKNLGYQTEIYVYKNQRLLPRIYFTYKIRLTTLGVEKDLFDELLSIKDNTKEALIECPDKCESGLHSPSDRIDIISSENGSYEIETNSKNSNWLVISESYYPGWQATVDNIPVKIYRANFLFGGIFIPGGKHVIKYIYEPPPIFNGLVK